MSSDEESAQEWKWLAESAKGNDDAFRALIERYEGRLLNFFLRAGAKEHAEDLVQETFLRLYRHRKRARPLARFTTFAHTLAHHAWLDHVRRQNRRLRLLERFALEIEQTDYGASRRPANRMDADTLLASLTPEHRAAVVMIIYQGLAYDEAAEAIGVPVGTVKSRVFNALNRMRSILNDSERGSPS